MLAGWWAYRLWGSRLAGVGALGFAVTDPNFLALSCVLSTDMGLTFFTLLACYLIWEYAAAPSRRLLFSAGIALGLALAAKFSAIAVVAGLGTVGIVFVLRGGRLALPSTPADAPRGRAMLEFTFRLGLISFITVAATYGFIHFDQWGSGLKLQLARAHHGGDMSYLNGQISRTGWYHYYLVLLPLKLPLGLLTGVLLVCVTGQIARAPRLMFFLVPALIFFALASYSRMNLGVRVVLPFLPFLYMIAAGLAVCACCRSAGVVLLSLCLLWSGISAWRNDPYPIAYFNELAGGSRGGLRYAADSNVDWGQGLPSLKAYLAANGPDVIYLSYFGTDRPELYSIRYRPLPTYGRVGPPGGEIIPAHAPRHVLVVSANNLLGIYLKDQNLFSWLRDREPTAILSGCLYVFDLSGDMDAISRLRSLPTQ